MFSGRNSILELIMKNSSDAEKKAFYLFSGEFLSYGELIGITKQTQSALNKFHVKPDDRIALIIDEMMFYLPLMLGIIETATLAPWEIDSTVEKHIEKMSLLDVDYLISNCESGALVESARNNGIGAILFKVFPDKNVEFRLVEESKNSNLRPPRNEEIAFIYTTSGTTSKLKVVPRYYEDILQSSIMISTYEDFDANSTQLMSIKLEREISQRLAIFSLITNGCIVYTEGAYPQRIISALNTYRITHFYFQPAGMIALLEYLEKNSIEYKPGHTMNLVLAGAPLPENLRTTVERSFNAQVIIAYGMTEVGHIASSYRAPKGFKEGSVGVPFYLNIRIHDGEIQVKGPKMFPGYENDPENNLASWMDGWFRTGDAGYLDDDGYLFITGRIKEMINRGGEKVSPYEVEEAILSLGNIEDTAVFPYPNRKGYESVGAVIVSSRQPHLSLQELRSLLKEKIKPFKLPTILYHLDRIPLSSANKVQRNLLYEQLQELGYEPELLHGSMLQEEELTSAQFAILEIWKAILDQEHLSLDDDFFDIGGDSLSAAEVLAAIESSLGCVLPVNDFFQKSTIRDLAKLVEESPKSYPFKHLVPIRPGGSRTPIFFIHEFSGSVVTYHHIVDNIDGNHPVYGLNLNLIKEEWGPATVLRDVALAYAREVELVSDTGPYHLAGLSAGGHIAFEVGNVFAERGFEVIVIMMDTRSRKQIRAISIYDSVQATLSGLKKIPVIQWPRLVHKKMGTFYQEFLLPELPSSSKNGDMGSLRKRWAALDSDQARQSVFLKSIIANHNPTPISGKVIYFRALQHKLKTNPSYIFWKSLAKDFKLIEIDCTHVDFVKPEYAAHTAREINNILALPQPVNEASHNQPQNI